MNRLQAEFDRLFAAAAAAPASEGLGVPTVLLDSLSRCRALVLDIGRPVTWSLVAAAGHAAQEELGLPAPAIAISGGPSFQLWWSLKDAVAAPDAARFLTAVQRRFLAELPAARVQLFPSASGANDAWVHARPVPALVQPDQWSAFVAPGLAPVFEETPWLDFPPNEEGQADLLRGLESVSAAQWQEAKRRLGIAEPADARLTGDAGSHDDQRDPSVAGALLKQSEVQGSTVSGSRATAASEAQARPPAHEQDPRRFLLRVMNDDTVDLTHRIEAAKALLPYTEGR